MIDFSPKPRLRLYGGLDSYWTAARYFLGGGVRRGNSVNELNRTMADMCDVGYGRAVPQARVGLYLALKAMIRPGKKVILSPYTIYDVVNMVLCAGGVPVFADIDRSTCNIDANEVDQLVDQDTAAVIATHLHGLACDLSSLKSICSEHGIPLIEDAAQAFGTRLNGRPLGTFGDVGIYSFGMAKNIAAFYGGMILTNRGEIAQRIDSCLEKLPFQENAVLLKRVAFCGAGDLLFYPLVFACLTFWIMRYGYLRNVDALNHRVRGEDDPKIQHSIPKSYLRRMTPMQAAVVLRQLHNVDADTKTRIGFAKLYHEGLGNLPDILLPPQRDDGSHSYMTYPIQVPDRQALLRYLMKRNRDLAIQHLRNNADSSCFASYYRDCPNARATASSVLLLPTYPSYGRREVEKNIAAIQAYFGRSSMSE